MESRSLFLSFSPSIHMNLNTQNPSSCKPISLFPPRIPSISKPSSVLNSSPLQNHTILFAKPFLLQKLTNIHLPFALTQLFLTTLPSSALETQQSASDKINLESILLAVDGFFNRYPFFVAGCTFVWLVVIPLVEYYFSKYKFISAIDAFRKLRDDPSAQLLDIRDKKSLLYLGSPNLKILNKNVVQASYSEEEEEEIFLKKVTQNFGNIENTVLCVLDNFDGNSIKVAELLVKNGFKEAYAIKGGVRGEKGWMAIQESLLPPSVHIYKTKKGKSSKKLGVNGAVVNQQSGNNEAVSLSKTSSTEEIRASHLGVDMSSNIESKLKTRPRSSTSPYPNYPDLKPPSSPTPSTPGK